MFKSKKFILAALLCASLGLAHADSNKDKFPHAIQVLEIEDGKADFESKFKGNLSGTNFVDEFTFSANGFSNLGIDLSAKKSDKNKNGMSIASFDLYNDVTNALVARGTQTAGGNENWNLSYANLASGDYFLRVSGQLLTNAADKFSGKLSMSPVSAVPETETYAMLLAGLGLIGFLSRRRRVNEKFT